MLSMRGRTRWEWAAGLAALTALGAGPTAGASGRDAPPEVRAGGPGAAASFEQGGPQYGAVDRRYSSPAAARRTVQAGHEHHHDRARSTSAAAARAQAVTTAATTLDPAVHGVWAQTTYRLPVRAVHATLLRTGKVLLIAGSGNQEAVFKAGTFRAGLLDPTTGAYQAVDPPYDMFCGGHAQLPNGNVLVVGGTLAYPTATSTWKGQRKVYEFDLATERWIPHPDMAHGRWYPSAVQAPSGNIWSFAGNKETSGTNTEVERYTVSDGKSVQKPAWSLPKYPGLLWTLKDKILYTGARESGSSGQPGLYDPTTGAVQPVSGVTDLNRRIAAASLFAGDATEQRAMLLGGGWPATDTTSYVDLAPTTPVGVAGPKLPTAKAYVGAVNLPTDGAVFETGGGTGRDTPVFESSIIRGSTVTPMAPNTVGRTYHSSTLLLPDGRVLTLGGDDVGDGFEMQVEIFSPPYLHQGTRPVITAAPSTAAYGSSFTVSGTATGATLGSVWLVRPSSTTHAVDPNQRAVRLPASEVPGGFRVATPHKLLTPPGSYMLFLNDSLGRPSVARWIKIG